ncbi:Pls/PosA family non-ribosomal peptide synthetase [Schlesneria paludicola]|uniref:Pls/PosA family non-ribosomal peptide synthetase n=1 Tax=Schlesneria paludicola TaxID=360056 RepID=UPI00029A2738|nr:Pls/PosA family non-ribosomal peptide synthetase [Schlesneria paludicola]
MSAALDVSSVQHGLSEKHHISNSRPAGTLSELFEAQADLHPDRIAVECGSLQMTYRELEQSANQFASHLRSFDVGPEDTVAFWLPRSREIYVALLGILKSGAAYVPLDSEYPADRVAYILQDAGCKLIVTTSDFADRLEDFQGAVVLLDRDGSLIADRPSHRLMSGELKAASENLCYVIYTSGSTGKPKGVLIEHRSAVHLVKTEAERFALSTEDRVYQGFSIAFDASVEELWLAWCAGATLVAALPDMIHAGPDLPRLLTEMNITVLSCVPTLLAMMEGELPTVRILIVGGETCSTDLVHRWCVPGRRMFNTYGPTEATVIATWTECDRSKTVTIGGPLPGYTAFVLDDNGHELPPGDVGELYLGGAGLARGYMGREDLTRERFVFKTVGILEREPQRLYRTGDLTKWTSDGQLEFCGRADGQIKLRGFRVELSEIESELLRCPGVRAAAVNVWEDTVGVQELVAYLVPRSDSDIDDEQLRQALRLVLPVYMIPTHFETIDSLPTLTSGKVDRKRLPAPKRRADLSSQPISNQWKPADDVELRLAVAWNEVFLTNTIGPDDDFFMDLGGHSLLAARMVSALRTFPTFASLSMVDVYHHPTISQLADCLRQRNRLSNGSSTLMAAKSDSERRDLSRRYRWCSVFQFIGLYFVIAFFSLQWLAPYLTYTFLLDDGYTGLVPIVMSLGTLVMLYPVMLVLSIVTKWLVIGRIKPGRYPLWGSYFLRWWFVQAIRNIVPTSYLTGTPLLAWYYRFMGAHIGANVYLGNDGCQAFDLLSIGEDSCLGADSHFTCATVEDGWLVLGSIEVGQRCYVGTRSVLRPGSRMSDDSELSDLSKLPAGQQILTGETWAGSPASRVDAAVDGPNSVAIDRPSLIRRFGYGVLYVAGVMFFPLIPMAAFFPGMIAMAHLNYIDEHYSYLVLSPFVATSFVVLISLEIVVVKWLLLGRVRPGTYPLYRSFYYRKWLVDRLLSLSLDVIGPLYSTLYLSPWYRLLGAKIGRRTEISTASFISPDCLQIGDESFVADAVSLGAAPVRDGVMTIGPVSIGQRSFVGNSALVPCGVTIPNSSLIGCLSMPPSTPMADGSSWLGSPSFFLPQRQASAEFTEQETFRPTAWLVGQRLLIEFFRITLPSTLFIIVTNVLLSAILLMRDELPDWQIIVLFPWLYAITGCAAAVVMIAFKWTLMGRYRPCERPLWSPFVWRTEVVTSLLDNFASPFFLDLLAGTPFICWFFRRLGAKIGKRVYLDTTELTEFDLVEIGSDVAVNLDCTLQTHLFEDRVMKMSTIKIGDGCSLGAMSLVLYDTEIGEGVTVGDLSLVMKGETLPPHTTWTGVPSRRTN